MMKSDDTFHPVDESGNEIDDLQVCFHGQGSFELEYNHSRYDKPVIYKPEVLFHKGDKNTNVRERTKKSLLNETKTLKTKFTNILGIVEDKLATYQQSLLTHFVPEKTQAIAIEGIHSQIKELSLRIQDCDRLSGLCE